LLRRVGLFSGEMVSWAAVERGWGEEAVRIFVGERGGRWRRERGAGWGGCGTFWSLVDCWLKRLTRSLIDRVEVAVDSDRGVSRRAAVVAAATGLDAARVVSDEGGSIVSCLSVGDRDGTGAVAIAAPGALLSAQRMLMAGRQHKGRVQTCAGASWSASDKRRVCSLALRL
jgi:hypothetical protein